MGMLLNSLLTHFLSTPVRCSSLCFDKCYVVLLSNCKDVSVAFSRIVCCRVIFLAFCMLITFKVNQVLAICVTFSYMDSFSRPCLHGHFLI